MKITKHIQDTVALVIAGICDFDKEDIKSNLRLETDLLIDEETLEDIRQDLMDEFDITIPSSRMADFETVNDLHRFIANRI